MDATRVGRRVRVEVPSSIGIGIQVGERPSRFVNSLRSYDIELDHQTVASIASGESVELEVEPGLHTVRGTIDWCGSPPVEVELSEDERAAVRVEVGRSTLVHMLAAVLFITIWRNQYLAMERVR